MLVTSLSSVHTRHCFWFAMAAEIGNLKIWFLEVLSIPFHFQVCLINTLESGRK